MEPAECNKALLKAWADGENVRVIRAFPANNIPLEAAQAVAAAEQAIQVLVMETLRIMEENRDELFTLSQGEEGAFAERGAELSRNDPVMTEAWNKLNPTDNMISQIAMLSTFYWKIGHEAMLKGMPENRILTTCKLQKVFPWELN